MIDHKQWLSSLPPPEGLLEKLQRAGRESLVKRGLPSRKDEAWRLTNLKRLESIFSLPISSDSNLISPSKSEWPKAQNNVIRIIVHPEKEPLEAIKLPEGLRSLDITEIEQLIESDDLNRSSDSSLTEIITNASAKNILALSASGKNIPPIELIVQGESGTFNSTKVLIIAEENTELELLQVLLGSNSSANSHLLRMHIGKDSRVKHGWMAFGDKESSFMANLSIKQSEDSLYSFTAVQGGWSLGRLEPNIIQVNGRANTVLRGLQVTKNKDQIATHSKVRFDGPEGSLQQLQKSIATDKSHSIFNGTIGVPMLAQRTNAAQLSQNLLLSKLARIDTKPELEIIADDVSCTHGATVSQLQEEEIFYLQSRGIGIEEAIQLLLKGYCKDILNHLPKHANNWPFLANLLEELK